MSRSRKLDSLTLTIFIALFLEFAQIVWAASKVDEGAQHSPSWVYYLQWGILAAIFFLGMAYLVRLIRLGKPLQKRTGLGATLVILVFLYFAFGYHPQLESFHEASVLGFARFVLMAVAGILVAMYGILGKPSEYKGVSSDQEEVDSSPSIT